MTDHRHVNPIWAMGDDGHCEVIYESIAEFNRVLVCPKGHLVDAPQHDACVPVTTVDDWDC